MSYILTRDEYNDLRKAIDTMEAIKARLGVEIVSVSEDKANGEDVAEREAELYSALNECNALIGNITAYRNTYDGIPF